jgi:hypothetical protein
MEGTMRAVDGRDTHSERLGRLAAAIGEPLDLAGFP